MAVIHSTAGRPASPRRRRAWWLLLGLIPIGLAIGSWFLTASLEDGPTDLPLNRADSDEPPPPPPVEKLPNWPEGPLKGDPAKKLLLASASITTARIARIESYTATFRKQERLGGKLGPENTLKMKVRNRPFAIYLKFLSPKLGKEVVYAEGHHENKVIAHNGDWTRKLVPRLAVAPDSAVALADSRHPVTEAGLVHLANKLLSFRKKDIGDPHAETTLDRITDETGRPWLRSVHTHSVNDGSRPFARVEILYDPKTQFPLQISSYDWPAEGQTGELELAERYAYDDLNLEAALTAADFDPANPDYAFMRY
jgi:hypothetical protein